MECKPRSSFITRTSSRWKCVGTNSPDFRNGSRASIATDPSTALRKLMRMGRTIDDFRETNSPVVPGGKANRWLMMVHTLTLLTILRLSISPVGQGRALKRHLLSSGRNGSKIEETINQLCYFVEESGHDCPYIGAWLLFHTRLPVPETLIHPIMRNRRRNTDALKFDTGGYLLVQNVLDLRKGLVDHVYIGALDDEAGVPLPRCVRCGIRPRRPPDVRREQICRIFALWLCTARATTTPSLICKTCLTYYYSLGARFLSASTKIP